MFTVTVFRADVSSDEVSEAMCKCPRHRYHVLPGMKTSLLIASEPDPGWPDAISHVTWR